MVLLVVVRGCWVGCDFGCLSGCGLLLYLVWGLESGGFFSEGKKGELGVFGDFEVLVFLFCGCEFIVEEVG